MNSLKNAPHTGNMLRAYVKKHRLSQSGWARERGITPKSVAAYLKNPSMRVNTLFAICQTLEYNFFKDIAAALPEHLPPHPVSQHETRVKELEEQVKQLEWQNATLKEALKLVGGG